jgi:hypothetical protein
MARRFRDYLDRGRAVSVNLVSGRTVSASIVLRRPGGVQVRATFDHGALTLTPAGGNHRAVVREFTTTANASEQIVVTFTTVTDNASIGGIEIIG